MAYSVQVCAGNEVVDRCLIGTPQDGSEERAKPGRIVSTRRRIAVGHVLAEELRELEADGMIDREHTGKPPAPVMCSLTG